jgi:excisionase family DNA binding protein
MAIMVPYSDGLNEKQRQRVAEFNPMSGTLHSIKEAAALLDVTTRTVQRWIEAGTLKAFKIGGRWRVPAGEIARLLHMDGNQGGGADENR